jgi:hypothetical protein
MNLQAYWNKVYSVEECLEDAAELFPCVGLFKMRRYGGSQFDMCIIVPPRGH